MSKSRFTTTTRTNLVDEPLHVCICGGSCGYREKSKGAKALQIHNGLSILEHQVKNILHVFPHAQVTAVVGFDAERVIRHRPQIPIIENQLYESTGTLEEIRLYLNSVFCSRLLLIDGAIFFDAHSLRFVENSNVLLYENDNPKEVGVQSENGVVEHFQFGIPGNEKWSGLVYLEGKSLTSFAKLVKRENNKLSLFEGLNLLLSQDVLLRSSLIHKAEIIKL